MQEHEKPDIAYTAKDKELLLDTAALLRDMADAVKEAAESENSFSGICREKNLDPAQVRSLLRKNTLQRCRIDNPVRLNELDNSVILLPDFYEKFYSHVFKNIISEDVILPPDYAQSAQHVIDSLPGREQEILNKKLGKDGKPKTLKEIASETGISIARTGQILTRIYEKARTGRNGKILKYGLKEYQEQEEKQKLENALCQIRTENEPKPAMNELQEKYLQTPVEELELSKRALHALWENRIETIGQLLELDRKEIAELPGAGPKTADEILMKTDAAVKYLRALDDMPDAAIRKAKLDADISTLHLTVRSHNALRRGGIRHVGTLMTMNATQFANIRNIGKYSIAEIRDAVGKLAGGIYLTDEEKKDYSLVKTLPLPETAVRSLNYNNIWIIRDLTGRTPDDLKGLMYVYETDEAAIRRVYEKLKKS